MPGSLVQGHTVAEQWVLPFNKLPWSPVCRVPTGPKGCLIERIPQAPSEKLKQEKCVISDAVTDTRVNRKCSMSPHFPSWVTHLAFTSRIKWLLRLCRGDSACVTGAGWT